MRSCMASTDTPSLAHFVQPQVQRAQRGQAAQALRQLRGLHHQLAGMACETGRKSKGGGGSGPRRMEAELLAACAARCAPCCSKAGPAGPLSLTLCLWGAGQRQGVQAGAGPAHQQQLALPRGKPSRADKPNLLEALAA